MIKYLNAFKFSITLVIIEIISLWNIWRYFELEFDIYFLNLKGFL